MDSTPTLLNSLRIQLRVVYALLMRELLTRYGRHNIGFLWLFIEPMLFTLGVSALWSAAGADSKHGLSVISFALTGYSSILLWRNAANRCMNAITPNLTLLYHRNVHIIDVFMARLLLEIIGATTSLVVLGLVFIAVGWMPPPADILTMVAAWLLLSGFAVGLGFVLAAISTVSEMFDRIWHVMTYLMFPLSGAMFMLEWFPEIYREMLLWIPMIHAVEMLREGYYGDAVTAYYSIQYIGMVDLCLILTGLLMVKQVQQRVIP
jgi:capsular polysaccharide transport system permease protein